MWMSSNKVIKIDFLRVGDVSMHIFLHSYSDNHSFVEENLSERIEKEFELFDCRKTYVVVFNSENIWSIDRSWSMTTRFRIILSNHLITSSTLHREIRKWNRKRIRGNPVVYTWPFLWTYSYLFDDFLVFVRLEKEFDWYVVWQHNRK